MHSAETLLSPRLSRLALALAAALLLVSVAAIMIQRFGACGSCTTQHGPWKLVAPAGAIGYGVLISLGLISPYRLFPIGSAIAAAAHTVLIAAMAALGKFCPSCVLAAALAVALFVVVLLRCRSRVKMIACVYVPAVLFASGPMTWALAQEQALERIAFARAIRDSRRHADRDSVLTIQVFEQDHCSYCRDFRELYLPQLERDFAERVRVRFLPATATNWVRRTPTIVIEGGPVYEGLPENYSELRSAVADALSSGK